ncbi:MAG: hypothetical protein J2P17_14650 [Mycobacterium sp.]|nr:hypothetical protein [Mycobacterium sp.]
MKGQGRIESSSRRLAVHAARAVIPVVAGVMVAAFAGGETALAQGYWDDNYIPCDAQHLGQHKVDQNGFDSYCTYHQGRYSWLQPGGVDDN